MQARLLDLSSMRAGINYTTPLAFSAAADAGALGLNESRAANTVAFAGGCTAIQVKIVPSGRSFL